MDFEIRTFFYITASIAFILLSLALIALLVLAVSAQRSIRAVSRKLNATMERAGNIMENTFYHWRRVSITGQIFRTLRNIFK